VGRSRLRRQWMLLFLSAICLLAISPYHIWENLGRLEGGISTGSAKFLCNNLRQTMISLSTHSNSLSHRHSSNWRNHDFLERHRVAGMHSSVEYIEKWDGHHVWCFQGSRFQSQELVERDSLLGVNTISLVPIFFFQWTQNGRVSAEKLTAAAAPALAAAILTPKIALAPNFFFPFVLSSLHKKASISFWSFSTSNFLAINAGAMMLMTF
jgi:hypothetical protein